MNSVNERPMAKLGEICSIEVGKTPARKNPSYWGLGHPWLSIRDMNQGSEIHFTRETITDAAVDEANMKLRPVGSVLFSFKLSIGKVSIAKIPLFTNEAIAALTPLSESTVDRSYLAHFLRYVGPQIQGNQAVMGVTLNKSSLAELEVPLPPLTEQQRIAEILDQAQSLVNDSVDLEEKSESLLKACFISTFGHPLDPENSTNRQRVGAVSKVVTGNTPPRKDPSNYGRTVEWLKSDNLGGLQPTPAGESLSDVGATKARIVGSGSTLITCIAGSRESIGKSSLLDRTAAFNQQINAIVPGEELDPLFLFAQVKTAPELVRQEATDGMKGIVSKKTLESVEILVPSMDHQRHYSETATEILALKEHTQLRTSELRDLHESLSTRAFSGQL